MTPLIGTCILSELFSNNTTANTEQVFNQNFEKIFTALMMRVSSTLSNQMPIPKSKVIDLKLNINLVFKVNKNNERMIPMMHQLLRIKKIKMIQKTRLKL